MDISKSEISDIVEKVQNDPNVKLSAAVNRVYSHMMSIEDGTKLCEDLQMVLGAAESCSSFFDQRKLTTETLGQEMKKAMAGYLRVSQSGGMNSNEADIVQACFDNWIDIGDMSSIVLPFIAGEVEKKVEELREADAETLNSLPQIIENVSYAMTDTAPTSGHRMARMLSVLGLDFGTGIELDWSMLREYHRRIRWDKDALEAANEDKEWPPLGWNPE